MDLCPKIRVNGIAPGSILTSALDIVASNEALRDPMEKATPMRRLGDPEDIAAAALYLAFSVSAATPGAVWDLFSAWVQSGFRMDLPPKADLIVPFKRPIYEAVVAEFQPLLASPVTPK